MIKMLFADGEWSFNFIVGGWAAFLSIPFQEIINHMQISTRIYI